MPSRVLYPSVAAICMLLFAGAMLTGCSGSYAIQGKVIEGPTPRILVVSKSDERLMEDDISGAGATVQGIFEPNNRIDRRMLSPVRADNRGRFSLPLDETGAGLLQYEATIIARKDGFAGVLETVPVPTRWQRLLIVMPRGQDRIQLRENALDEALRDARPYLDE